MGNRPQQPDRQLLPVRFGAERGGEYVGTAGSHLHTVNGGVEDQSQPGRGALHPELTVERGDEVEAAG